VDANVPHALALITARALEKNPDHRYRSARALSRELRHWLDENTITTDGDTPVAAPQRSRLVWAAAAAAFVVGGAALWATLGSRSTPAPAAPAISSAVGSAASSAAAPLVAASALTASAASAASATLAAAAGAADATALTPEAAASAAAGPAPAMAAAAMLVTPTAAGNPIAREPMAPPATSALAATAFARAASAGAREPKESPKDRRAREARERDARLAGAAVAAPLATGVLRIAVSPWGEIEVDGKPAGTSPPLTELNLTEGTHQIVIRNADLPAHSVQVNVTAGQATTLKHKF
jgi:eukaryotic-like serine/threonine-protein kinase